MLKSLLFCSVLLLLAGGEAVAQDGGARDLPPQDLTTNGGAGVRSGNITSTGQTVPNPGVSQGAGTTSLDRGIQAEDTKIQSSICKGC